MKAEKRIPLSKSDLKSYNPLNVVGNKENVDFLLAGFMGNNMINFWISTDGRLFADQGIQMGRTIMEAWIDGHYFISRACSHKNSIKNHSEHDNRKKNNIEFIVTSADFSKTL